ncbi:type ISP restriction/modification enzyme, partial [Thiospirillum jenense]|nr:DNA methyltransferase [Thiospirillum jenense]
IKETYLAASTAQKTKLYDPFVRFLRWASDRIGEYGIVGFITNRSYLDARQADGLRKVLAMEFQEIWIVDLMSDVRKNPKISGTQHNVFGIQTGVAITFLVRNPTQTGECHIRYLALDDFLLAIEKRRWLTHHSLRKLERAGEFCRIRPSAKGEWLNQPTEDWSHWLAVASKDGKAGKTEEVIFKLYSQGIKTNRDDWIYGYSKEEVYYKTKYLVEFYNTERVRWKKSDKKQAIELFVDRRIKWTTELIAYLTKNTSLKHKRAHIMSSAYRPYFNNFFYHDKIVISRTYQLPKLFPEGIKHQNIVIGISGVPVNKPFQTLAVSLIPCYDLLEHPHFLPLWTYADDGIQHDNITDWSLNHFQQQYHDTTITKRAIFDYVYAVLHDPRYRQQFALNLKSEFPRIPIHPDFWAWSRIGGELVQLHTEFETVPPWPLKRIEYDSKTAPKCRLKANKTDGTIEIDSATTLMEIPAVAWEYQLGSRSALEWVLDQYKERTPKDSTIREQFNTYQFADYKEQVIELLARVCRVSVETVNKTQQLAQLTWAE